MLQIKENRPDQSKEPNTKFPVVDDIYDDDILTDPKHQLFSLQIAGLHWKLMYNKTPKLCTEWLTGVKATKNLNYKLQMICLL